MSYFDILLEELQVETNVPLWKIVNQLDEERQKELVKFINDNLNDPYKIGREVCLLYACWWRYKYSGGRGGHNYDQIIKDYGILNPEGNTDALFRSIVKNELTKWRQLNIPLYQGESGNNRYLDSVLAQGGIPEAFLRMGNNNFLNYLVSLINYYQQCDFFSINWHDKTIARQKSRYLPESFRNEAFYKICLSIVRSVINDTDEFSDYQDIKEIIRQVKEQSVSAFSSAFRIAWSIEINATTAHLCYSLHVPQKIKAVASNHNAPIRRYYLDECFVAEYRLIGEQYVLMSHISIVNKKANMEDSALFLQYTEEDAVPHDGRLFMPPQLDEPMLLQIGDGNCWMIGYGHGESYMGCLIPDGWTLLSEKSINLSKITIDNMAFDWCTVDWDEISALEFKKNDMHIFLNNQIVDERYDVVLNLPHYDWIVRASSLIIPKNEKGSQINLYDGRRIYVKDEREKKISIKEWQLKYKGYGMADFEDYDAACVPCGKVIFSVELPNNQHERFSAFVVNELNYLAQDSITFSAGNDVVTTLGKENRGITKDGNTYLYDSRDMTKQAIYLNLSANGSNIRLDVEIPTSNSVFVDLEDKVLADNYRITLNDIDYFRVFLVRSRIVLKYINATTDRDETIASSNVYITPNCFHSLSYAREVIEKLLLLYPSDRNTEIRITAGQKTIIVVPHIYDTYFHRDETGFGIQILANCKPVNGLNIAAVTLSNSDVFDVVDLIPADEGKYLIPADFSSMQMIVFSRNATQGISPVRVDPTENIPDYVNMDSVKEHQQKRNEQKKSSIDVCHESLVSGNKKEWDSVWYYWNLVHDNHLPYSTFNCFLAMASDPMLLAKFCSTMYLHSDITNWGENAIVWELERMEYELGFAFHYIPRTIWKAVRQDICAEYDKLPDAVHNVLKVEDYLNNSLKYAMALLNNQFEEAGSERLCSLMCNILFGYTLIDERLVWDDFQHYLDEGIPNTYLSNNTSDPQSVECINIPYCRCFNNISFIPPQINNRNRDAAEWFMQYHSIVMPQIAAKNAFEYDTAFWKYDEQFNIQRRLINYIRRYAKKVYNDIFITAFNEKMKNNN